ncbi:MAG: FtsW/RodA/SpoVE family cell cycle protein [Bacillota bacterium]
MTNIGNYPEIVLFLDSVCGQVRAKKLHYDIREELSAHLEELVKENLNNGMTEKEAVDLAVSRMGEPYQIGRQLDHTHRPKTDWFMIVLVALLSGVGLLAMYSLQTYGTGPASYMDYFDRKMVFIGIGAVLMAILWACDYQKIKKYSEYIFGFGVLLLIWVNFFGTHVNGQTAWYAFGAFGFYIPTVSILMMIVGFAGIKPLREHDLKGSILLIGYRGILPILLLMKINVITMALLYSLIFIFYLWLTKRYAWQVIAFVGSSVLLMVYAFISKNDMYSRAFGFLNQTDDPYGSDYMITRSLDTMKTAGWWGKGEFPMTIRYPQSDGFLPSFINYFGWVAGAVVLLLIMGFIGKSVITSTKIKDGYGKLLFASIGALFALQFIWAVAMIFGYAPLVGITLPFLSYGGTDQIIHLAAMGLLLGIYRRRDMVPVQAN